MKFLVISHVIHSTKNNEIFGYGPYVKEMNLWFKYVDEVCIVAPMRKENPDAIDLAYVHNKLSFKEVPSFNLLNAKSKIKTMIQLPYIFMKIFMAMLNADHIHLRCPGNMGLLGVVAQIFFPWKMKTVKYAGNWDPNSQQPRSYRMQKFIISNTMLSKNMKVLVYGKWPSQSKNIVEFFTATYTDKEKMTVARRSLNDEIRLMFVGALSPGKRPMIAVESLHKLIKLGIIARLDLMGEGIERKALETYIKKNNLENYITLHGNQNADFVKEKYQQAHFLILMSKSEGWPKVVAEAMFWGCVPVTTNVSCVNFMIGEGSRGALVLPTSDAVCSAIKEYITTKNTYEKASEVAMQWSQQFTLDSFEREIKGLLDA